MPRVSQYEPPELRRARRASQRAMLRHEARLLARLRAIGQRATSVSQLISAASFTINRGIIDARLSADQLLTDELETLGLGLPAGTTGGSGRDAQRALRAGRGYGLTVAKHVAAFGLLGAVVAADWKAKQIAATEVSVANNDERARRIATVEYTGAGIVLGKWWDASMDRRTCPVCERADGTVRPAGLSFPDGEPGDVHPNCRCFTAIVPLPIAYNYDVKLTEAA